MKKLHTRFRIFTDSPKIQGFTQGSRDSLEIQKIQQEILRFTEDSCGFTRDSQILVGFPERFKLKIEDSELNSLVVAQESICTKVSGHCKL